MARPTRGQPSRAGPLHEDGAARIVRVIPGGPASRDKRDIRLQAGDKIIAVARGLQTRGHDAVICVPGTFEAEVRAAGLRPILIDPTGGYDAVDCPTIAGLRELLEGLG